MTPEWHNISLDPAVAQKKCLFYGAGLWGGERKQDLFFENGKLLVYQNEMDM